MHGAFVQSQSLLLESKTPEQTILWTESLVSCKKKKKVEMVVMVEEEKEEKKTITPWLFFLYKQLSKQVSK